MDTTIDIETARSALAEAARFAGLAPSIHNTQPWRWRLVGSALELRAERDRQLDITDPAGHLLHLSCGAALHHAATALTAEGWRAETRRISDRTEDDLLASMTVTGRIPVTPQAMRAVQMLRVRHTDRRPVSDTPPSSPAIAAIADAASTAGASLHVLRPDDILDLAAAADRAQEVELADPAWLDELAYWAGGDRPEGSGVPDEVIPDEATQTTVPSRNFGRSGRLKVSAGHDGAAVYGILYGQDDTPGGWLRAGEALSAAWVAAIEHGLSVLPLSAAVEVPVTRLSLRRILGYVAEPYLALRLGVADPDEPGPAHTPRLPVDQILEVRP
jgi:nitroreductase